MIAQKIENFFQSIEEIWAAIPAYVKVFVYSSVSATFGLWVAGNLDWREVIIIVATNIGIYQVPRSTANITRKLM